MRFHHLDLNLLVALDALLTERSITRAAQQLHISQPAMSGSLARLREFFEDELLVQVGRKMLPTGLGESLAEPVRAALLQIETTICTRPDFSPSKLVRHFRLLVSDYVAAALLPRVLPRLEQEAPGVTLQVFNHISNPWDALARSEVDFLILPTQYLQEDQPASDLFTDEFVCLVWQGNQHIADSVDMAQYLALGHVVARLGNDQMPYFDEWFLGRFGHVRRVELTASSFHGVAQMLVGTQRIATVHKRLADICCRSLPVRQVQPPLVFPTLTEAIVWPRHFDKDPASVWLRSVICDAAGAL
jgi:LysR family nod box-dependent transcriptional activator